MNSRRLNITLSEAHAAKLSRLAARVHVNEGTPGYESGFDLLGRHLVIA